LRIFFCWNFSPFSKSSPMGFWYHLSFSLSLSLSLSLFSPGEKKEKGSSDKIKNKKCYDKIRSFFPKKMINRSRSSVWISPFPIFWDNLSAFSASKTFPILFLFASVSKISRNCNIRSNKMAAPSF